MSDHITTTCNGCSSKYPFGGSETEHSIAAGSVLDGAPFI